MDDSSAFDERMAAAGTKPPSDPEEKVHKQIIADDIDAASVVAGRPIIVREPLPRFSSIPPNTKNSSCSLIFKDAIAERNGAHHRPTPASAGARGRIDDDDDDDIAPEKISASRDPREKTPDASGALPPASRAGAEERIVDDDDDDAASEEIVEASSRDDRPRAKRPGAHRRRAPPPSASVSAAGGTDRIEGGISEKIAASRALRAKGGPEACRASCPASAGGARDRTKDGAAEKFAASAGASAASEDALGERKGSTMSELEGSALYQEEVDACLSQVDVEDVVQASTRGGRGPPDVEERSESTRRNEGEARRGRRETPVAIPVDYVDDDKREEQGDVVFDVQTVSFLEQRFQRKWKAFACSTVIVLVALTASLSALLNTAANDATEAYRAMHPPDAPSMQPSSPPSHDPRPTLEIVRTRGHVRCGLKSEDQGGFRVDLCRAVAAVLFGNPASFVGVPIPIHDRFRRLDDREIDLLIRGDTHTVEREVKERTTGSGFAFSSPYQYDGLAYYGDETFVRCAEDRKRFDECSSLRICVKRGSSTHDFLQNSFPPDFVLDMPLELAEMAKLLSNDTCNAIASDRSALFGIDAPRNGSANFVVGDRLFTKEPLAMVTRNADREFSDVANWVVQALFYGEERGLTKDSSLCRTYANSTSHRASDLNFMNAVRCVGNYGDIFEEDDRGMNRINDGTSGMLYATPFGRLRTEMFASVAGDAFLDVVRRKGTLNCGVVVPDDFDGDIEGSVDGLVGMSVDYCRTVTTALFHGHSEPVTLIPLSAAGGDDGPFAALDGGSVDVLAGARVEKKYDFKSSNLFASFGGVQFSTPYYFGDEAAGEDVSFYSLATREDDAAFSSFVNIAVLSTIYAQEKGMKREKSEEAWVVRDAIDYSGSHYQLFAKNFPNVSEGERGRNRLNGAGGPQIHSFPGLAP